MKRLKHFLIIIFSITAISSYTQQQNFNWLIGTWKIIKPQFVIYETWVKKNDTTYIAKSFTVNNNDTTIDETIELSHRNHHWFYIATTANQNNQKPVAFKLIYIGNSEFIATNPKHNYPQRIAYRLIDNTNLYTNIEGNVKGKYKKGNYDFVKAP